MNTHSKMNRVPNPYQCTRFIVTVFAWLALAVSGLTQTTITWQEDWESPTAQDNWAPDLGYWEIGVPTYGPPTNSLGWRAHQGTNVAATVLNGNYTDDRQSRLISSPIQVPAANVNPRLRFWHWWSFNCYDYGQVQISTNNGVSWVGLSPAYGHNSGNYDSSGKWTRGWLDLTPYAGRTVRIALFFFSASGTGCDGSSALEVGPGWYVDEVVIESGPLASMVFSDDFEDVSAGDRWTANFGVWEIGVPTSGPPPVNGYRAHSGSNCLATILSGNYTDDRTSRVSSQPLVVPAANMNPRLRFWHWWSFNCYDYGQVQISTNNGVSWVGLSPAYGHNSGNYDSSGKWTRGWLDLTPYAGKTVRIGFNFVSGSGTSCDGSSALEVGPGWYIDEVVIESGPLADMLASDSFEDTLATDRWTADFGVWEIGVPTSGPPPVNGYRAHSGSNCLATILSGNYTDDRTSRISSQPILLPPAQTNPRLRFWHWWSFNCYDYGQVQISTNNATSWVVLATYSSSSPWTRPQLDLTRYAGKTVRIAFFFFSASGTSCDGSSAVEVGPGWYLDEIRVLHDPALLLLGSPVVRTQEAACVSLAVALDSPASGASFVLEAPAGNLNNARLSTEGCWSGTITPQSSTQWLVNLQSTCSEAPAGTKNIGSICFTAVSAHSAFVPLSVESLVISNLVPTRAYGTRAVNIANEPLLESWLGRNRQRMLTTYGTANTPYEIRWTTNVTAPTPWTLGWTSTVPLSLFTNAPIVGPFSNAPTLFLRANE